MQPSRAGVAGNEERRVSFAEGREQTRDPQRGWKVDPRYRLQEHLGSGSYGCVCQAHDEKTGCAVAIKRTRHLFSDSFDTKKVLREISILSTVSAAKHPNVVQIYDLFAPVDPDGNFDEIYLVLEVADSDLRKMLKRDFTLPELHVRRLFYTLLLGLRHLHALGVWHRDLKPANCLVNKGCEVKICDFGLSRALGGSDAVACRTQACLPGPLTRAPCPRGERLLQPERPEKIERFLTTHVVTRWYRAPELILLQAGYTEAVDVWSAGCIFAELLGALHGVGVRERAPLFPGSACYPLSPHAEGDEQRSSCLEAALCRCSRKREQRHQRHDQLEMIFDVIGTPSEGEVERLEPQGARAHLRSFAPRQGTGVRPRVRAAGEASCDLLERALRFDPSARPSVSEMLEHPAFSEAKLLGGGGVAEPCGPIELPFEREASLGKARLRELMCQEIRKFRPGGC